MNDQKIASIEAALASSRQQAEDVRHRLGAAGETELPALRQELQGCQRSLIEKDGLLATFQRDMDAQTKALEGASTRSVGSPFTPLGAILSRCISPFLSLRFDR